MDRLTDQELAVLDKWDYIAENAKRSDDAFDGFECRSCRVSLSIPSEYDPVPLCSDCQWRAVDSMAAELRERRAADLDKHDVMALRWLRQFADGPARRALDKLIGKETEGA